MVVTGGGRVGVAAATRAHIAVRRLRARSRRACVLLQGWHAQQVGQLHPYTVKDPAKTRARKRAAHACSANTEVSSCGPACSTAAAFSAITRPQMSAMSTTADRALRGARAATCGGAWGRLGRRQRLWGHMAHMA